MKPSTPVIERHPWPPFMPRDARLLMLGTFPPKPERWSMPFYYPNRINDFWRICGMVFYGNRDHFWNEAERRFRQADIERMLTERRIALWDTGMAVRRLRDNASDKFLEIVEELAGRVRHHRGGGYDGREGHHRGGRADGSCGAPHRPAGECGDGRAQRGIVAHAVVVACLSIVARQESSSLPCHVRCTSHFVTSFQKNSQ